MRKPFGIAALILIICASSGFAATIPEIPFVALSPEVMGMGGAFVADTRGFNSFFFNPAGFSRGPGTFTLLDASTWVYSRPDQLADFAWQSMTGTATTASTANFLSNQITTGGFGIGASMGIGYVGNGLGLGLVIIEDTMLYGPSALGALGNLTATVGFIGGLAVPFDIFGFKLHVGGDIRPMIRIHAVDFPVSSMLGAGNPFGGLNSANTVYGAGIGLDLGAIAEMGWFTLGLSIRDLGGTQFKYNMSSWSSVMTSLGSSLTFPSGTAVTADQYVIPMDIAFGVGFHPDMGSFNRFVDPSMSIDMHDLVGALAGTSSIWTLLHVGAQVKLISLFTVRAGLDQGYLTFGAGMKLFFFDLNFAVFTRELGQYIGDQPNSGASINVAIRW